MTLGASLFLIALGAILAFAVEVDPEGFQIDTVGWILMIVGLFGLVLALFFRARSSGPVTTERRRTVVEDRDPDVRRREYRDY